MGKWASEQTVLPSCPRPGQGAPHRDRTQRVISKEEEQWCPTLSPFLSHALLSDEVLLPGASMKPWRAAWSVALMGLLYMESNKTRGKWLPLTGATPRGCLWGFYKMKYSANSNCSIKFIFIYFKKGFVYVIYSFWLYFVFVVVCGLLTVVASLAGSSRLSSFGP